MSRHLCNLKPIETEDNVSPRPIEDLILLNKIGEGTSGEVWRAKRLGNNTEEFAAKVLNFNNPLNLEKAVMNEVRLTRKLGHKHVVGCYGLYENDDNYVIIYELAKGGSLAKRLQKVSSFSEKDAAHIIKQVAKALEYIHGNSVMHRDVKPENIFSRKIHPDFSHSLSKDEVCLGDFGFAHESEDNKAGDTLGPTSYIAPEVLLSHEYTNKVDMWSLGVITYELLSGTKLYPGDDIEVKHQEVKNKPILLMGENWTYISKDAKNFVHCCLERDPEKRISAKEALNHRWLKNGTNLSSRNLKALHAWRNRVSKIMKGAESSKNISSKTSSKGMKPSGSTTSLRSSTAASRNQRRDPTTNPAHAGSANVASDKKGGHEKQNK